MRRLFGRWKARHLLLSWVAYWAALAAVYLAPAVAAVWRVSRPGVKGDASASIGDGVLHLSVTAAGSPIWSGAISLTMLALLVAGPPIALWLCWLVAASSSRRPDGDTSGSGQLASGDEMPFRRDDRVKDELHTM